MKKLTDFIVEKRYFVLVIFIVLSILSLVLSSRVNINYDMSEYLPSDSETRIGIEIMEEEFPSSDDESSFKIMFKNLSDEEKKDVYNYLINVDGIDSVDYDESDLYNKDGYTLYVINVLNSADSKEACSVYEEVSNYYQGYEVYMSGDIYSHNHSVLPIWIVGLAIFCAMIILIIMCESYIEPFLFLFTILLAVLLNNGTNIIFDSVSNITNSIAAILQMALSMDYSIMLINRYRQERENDNNKVSAMKKALYNAFKSISSSSVTTIVGLVVLVFMSFTIGRDLGLVLAKGVLFSLISIFCCLPGLILLFDNLIKKTMKKTINIKLDFLGKFNYKFRKLSIICFIILFVTSCLLKGSLGIFYSEEEINNVKMIFPEDNQMAIIYNNDYESMISNYCKKLEQNENVKNVLCYGNTLNDKLTYQEMNNNISSLSSNIQIDDYLLKMIYYNYYNKDISNKMSFNTFVSFINNDVYNNSDINIDSNIKNYIKRLENFVYLDNINKKRNIEEIANILDMDSHDVESIFIYYGTKNNNLKLTIDEFISFIKNYVLTNEEYASSIDNNMLDNINTLDSFANKNLIMRKMSSTQMSKAFGINSEVVNNLYLYYASINSSSLRLTINEFSSFVLENVELDSELKEKIILLKNFSDKDFINKKMSFLELSNVLGIDEDAVKEILLLKNIMSESNSKYSLSEFISNVIFIKNNSTYLDDLDISNLESLNNFVITKTERLSKDELVLLFGSDLVNMVYNFSSLFDDYTFTITDFVNLVLNDFSDYLDSDTINNLSLIKMILEDDTKYSSKEISSILGISSNTNMIYGLIDFYNNDNLISPYEFIGVIIDNKSITSNYIDEDMFTDLEMLFMIMNNIGNEYTYQELVNVLSLEEETVRNVYILYMSNDLELSPKEFVDFILDRKDDQLLKSSLDNKSLNTLILLQEVMNSVLNNYEYSSKELSKLIGINREELDLIYSLYDYKFNSDNKLSLYEFINFIVDNVLVNDVYASNFDEDSKNMVKTIKMIMDDSINNKKYTNDELSDILDKFSDEFDRAMIELLYIYYGSVNNYDESWQLTIEECINYLNNDIMSDNIFKTFIDNDMKKNITNAYSSVLDAKDLLVGENYSRVVINTSYKIEDEETFAFITKIKDDLSSSNKDIYIIGDSPMVLDISLSFDDELNFITILTMIAIFMVVCFTFKSFIIPFILVFIIQCAVFMIMGILSVAGSDVYYIAILIVQSILMGATIDYAILYTSYYLEYRKKMDVKETLIMSYNKSIHTILTSSSILILVTLIIGQFAEAIAAKICRTLSQGTLCSTLLILLLLPGLLALFDRFIVKDMKKVREKN